MQGKRALLIVDEAQNLGRESIEELRMLSNFQIGTHSLLQSFLVGQPELRNLLKSKAMEQLRQRVTASCHLTPLDCEDTRKYIEHRLHRVGWAGNPEFSIAAYAKIHAWTAGVPRRINRLCNRLMLAAYLQERTGITEQMVVDTAAQLRSEIGGLSDFAPVSAGATDEAVGGDLDLDLEIDHAGTPAGPAGATPEAQEAAAMPLRQPPQALAPLVPSASTLLCVCDSAAGFWKLAALAQSLAQSSTVPAPTIVHTGSERAVGQGVDPELMAAFTAIHLALDVGDYGRVVAAATARFDAVLEQHPPAALLVAGTQNATLACALLARKRGIPVMRLDAGRVHGPDTDATLNGALLDRLAAECLTQNIADSNRLIREGKPAGNVHFMGSLAAKFIGIAFAHLRSADRILSDFDLPDSLRGRYGVLAWRFPTMSDPQHVVAQVAAVLRHIAQDIPLVWPLRPAERRAVIVSGCDHLLEQAGVIIVRDRGYIDLLALLRHARCLASGAEGQLLEEAGALGITTVTVGAEAGGDDDLAERCDVAVGLDAQLAQRAVRVVDANDNRLEDRAAGPDIWDGGATSRVTKWLAHWLGYTYRARRKDKETAE